MVVPLVNPHPSSTGRTEGATPTAKALRRLRLRGQGGSQGIPPTTPRPEEETEVTPKPRGSAYPARTAPTLRQEEAEPGPSPRPSSSRDQRRGLEAGSSQAPAGALSRSQRRRPSPPPALPRAPGCARPRGPESPAAAARANLPGTVPAPRHTGSRAPRPCARWRRVLAVGTPDPAARLAQPRLAPPGGRGQAALLLRPRDAEPGGGPRGTAGGAGRAAAGGRPGRGLADRVHVLGGRGAEEEDEDLPALSDSGDEAAWEDEDGDEAGLPHDKQQTPCLFCDRFVSPP